MTDEIETIFEEFSAFRILYIIAAIIIAVGIIATIVSAVRRQNRKYKNKPPVAPPPPAPKPQPKANVNIDPFDLSETVATIDDPFSLDTGTTVAAMAVTAAAMQSAQVPQTNQPQETIAFCPFCGAPKEEGKYCPFCGNKYEP